LNKDIVFIAANFPLVSQTFVVSNIVEAIKKNLDIQVLTSRLHRVDQSSQSDIISKYDLIGKTSCFVEPIKKNIRYKMAIRYLLDIKILYYFIKYAIVKEEKISLTDIFLLQYYRPFRKSKVFHVHFANAALLIAQLKRIGFLKSKVIVTFHGYDAFFENDLEKKELRKKYKTLFAEVDSITVNTPYLKKMVMALGNPQCPLTTVPVGINTTYYCPTKNPKTIDTNRKIQCISIGRLIEFKGHKYGILAIKELIDKGYDLQYTIIGEGVLYNELQKLIKELVLEDHVILYGKGTQEEIKKALDKADVFLMTSIADSKGREETQGVVSAEAQAMGVPVIGFNSGGVPYTVTKKTGILVQQKDTKALSNEIGALIIDKNRYQSMSFEARKWVIEQFDISNMIDNYYQDII